MCRACTQKSFWEDAGLETSFADEAVAGLEPRTNFGVVFTTDAKVCAFRILLAIDGRRQRSS
jgi:hypothetical protein